MMTARTWLVATLLTAPLLIASACKPKEQPGAGLIPDAASLVAVPPDAGAAPVDLTQCAGCQLTAQNAWTFEGIYRDDHCTEPLAQTTLPACAQVPTLGPTTLTYVDEIQSRKAGSSAAVTLVEPILATAARFRKAGTACMRANEGATDITPAGCNGARVCRDATGALACASCRTFVGGCPDYEETRMYASINDPELKGLKGGKGGGGDAMAKLRQCCDAIGAEAKRQNNAPELVAASTQCHALVAAAGPSGNAPELATIRALLAGRNLPAVCAGL
jgi:hypothetical protein